VWRRAGKQKKRIRAIKKGLSPKMASPSISQAATATRTSAEAQRGCTVAAL